MEGRPRRRLDAWPAGRPGYLTPPGGNRGGWQWLRQDSQSAEDGATSENLLPRTRVNSAVEVAQRRSWRIWTGAMQDAGCELLRTLVLGTSVNKSAPG